MSFHHVQNKYPEKPVIKYESTIIPYSSSVKFLGVWMDENLKWSVHLHNLEMKLSKICFALRILVKASSVESARTMYFAYFHSVLTYGIMVWGNSTKASQIFKLQKRAIAQVSQRSSCIPLFKILQILPLPSTYVHL